MTTTHGPAIQTALRPQDDAAAGFHEDGPVLDTIRFRPRTLVASDRHLARFLKFVREFPRAVPPDA